jgi:mannose-6-phosphate isomerase-like protein (cupin superfamily)
VTPFPWHTSRLPAQPTTSAPDGSDVRVLLAVAGGSAAHFELGPGQTSVAVVHRTVEEIWYVLKGRGEMWRQRGDDAEVVDLAPDTCLTIPIGTKFQFRAFGYEALSAVGTTMPPWPGEDEAVRTEGPWSPTVPGPPVAAA